MFIIFAQETTISPPESSWWGEYNINGTALVRQQTQVYQKDLIGIKSLESQGRATFATLPGKHVQITEDDIRNVVIPFILGR
jgi:palmitoyl-protein thioesterase